MALKTLIESFLMISFFLFLTDQIAGKAGPSKVTLKQTDTISKVPEKIVIQPIPATKKSKTKSGEKRNVEKVAIDTAPKKKEVAKKALDNVKKVMVDAASVKRGSKPGMKHKPQSSTVAGKLRLSNFQTRKSKTI